MSNLIKIQPPFARRHYWLNADEAAAVLEKGKDAFSKSEWEKLKHRSSDIDAREKRRKGQETIFKAAYK